MSALTSVVVLSMAPHRLVLPSEHVDRIGGRDEAPPEDTTDLATLLRIPAPEGARRAVRVLAGERARWLLVGGSISVRSVPAGAFVGFPRWLDGAPELACFAGLVAMDEGFALELRPSCAFDGTP